MGENYKNTICIFLDYLETGGMVLDGNDVIVKINDALVTENQKHDFFRFNEENSYSLNKIDRDDWYKYLSICLSTGASKFILKYCFFECVMTRLSVGDDKFILVNFFENRSLKEDVADFFMNDFRLSQLKELSEMAASIAHEINNPLTVISARTQMMKQYLKEKKPVGAEVFAQNLEKIYVQSDRIKKIVDGMRVFSRNSSVDGRTVYNVKTLVEEAFSLVAGGIRDSGIEFNFDLVANEKYILCKPNELIQVLVNMFNNSIYALSKTTFPKISIQFEEDSAYYNIYFSDNGPGIPLEYDNKIFAPFFTTKPVGAGTGLGLSISNRILQSYGGSLKLDRTRGNSCFHIRLAKKDGLVDTAGRKDDDIFKFSS